MENDIFSTRYFFRVDMVEIEYMAWEIMLMLDNIFCIYLLDCLRKTCFYKFGVRVCSCFVFITHHAENKLWSVNKV